MPPRPSPHAEAVSRRLELLSAELAGAPDLHTHLRVVPPPGSVPPEPAVSVPALPEPVVTTVPAPGRHAARRGAAGLVPERWRGSVLLAPGPVAVVAVLVAVGLAVCCWWLLGSRPAPVDVRPAGQALATPVPVDGTPSPSAAAELVVDVAGKVRRPGIAVLPPGSRVVDALKAAGGPQDGVDLAGLNLARLLVDGEQVLVGVAPPPGVAASAAGAPGAAAGSLVNLNTASEVQLEELPGVGPVTAKSIVAFRTEHGAFRSVEELLDVSGIGEATLAEIAPHVTV